ncbi:exo-beta-N-acetylmuramidase NamZ domain-containing protein [Actinomadura keratinilytica]
MTLSRRSLLAATTAAGALTATTAAPALAQGGPPGRGGRGLRTGFEQLADSGYRVLAGQKVGVVTNPTGVTREVRHIVDVMHADRRVDLRAVFGPEHGFRGTAQAGGSEGRYDDPATGLPVYDTYLTSGQKLADIFTESGVDTVVFDIQDAGARFYTYIWTLYDCMEAAALAASGSWCWTGPIR